MAPGARPFSHVKPALAISDLRRRLGQLGVAGCSEHRLHDFRRGHAEDLFQADCPLVTILKAGEWRSAAFLDYLRRDDVEARAVMAAQMAESSDSE